MYDAIIVGARCAGSPLAMLLANAGRRVLLLDRSTFPSDTVSTLAITGDGAFRLQRWGLLNRVLDSGCPPVHRVRFWVDGEWFGVEPPLMNLCPRRYALDEILFRAAEEAGVHCVEGASVRRVLWEDGRVCGVRYQDRSGKDVEARATVVVGADGRNSMVAREVSAELHNERPGATCAYFSYWKGIPADEMEIYFGLRRAVFLFPTHDDSVLLAAQWPGEEFADYRSDPLNNLISSFRLAPGLSQRVRAGERIAPVVGMLTPDSYFRRSAGPGWALAGDAGNFKDPILGLGINDAFRSADQLAEAIEAGLSGMLPMDEALAGYEAIRDKTSLGSYQVTHRFASLNVSPAMLSSLVERLDNRRSA
ncbi:MAG: NAD(P)/FAD-dependent oxidoreductase [bacterium]